MKKIWIAGIALLFGGIAEAQQTEGKIVYERTVEMRVSFGGMSDEMQRMIPRTRTDKIEVSFANNQSVRRQLPPEETDEQAFNGTVNGGAGGGPVIRMMAAGADDILFSDLGNSRYVEQREFGTRKYIIADTIRKLNWKLTGETKTVLGIACQQAIAQRIGKRMQSSMANGEVKREEVADTSNFTAWFAPSIPVSAGPEVQGQLPGLILALDINNGRTVYRALELSPKVDAASIKEPKTGKKVTTQEFAKEQEEVMKNMQRNNGGRNVIRVGA
jgi:GLPGLI family protein